MDLQQPQMPSHLVYNTLGRRPYSQYCRTPAGNLCPPCVVDNVRHHAQADGLRLQYLQLLLALDLQRNLCLAQAFPSLEYARVGCVPKKVLVAGQCRMPALRANFA